MLTAAEFPRKRRRTPASVLREGRRLERRSPMVLRYTLFRGPGGDVTAARGI